MRVVLSLGTNTNYANIQIAEERLNSLFSAVRVSRMVVSPAVNSPGEIPDFANAVMVGETSVAYEDFRDSVKAIECELGRRRESEYGRVEIDIDILEYGEKTYKVNDWDRPYNVLLLKELDFIQ